MEALTAYHELMATKPATRKKLRMQLSIAELADAWYHDRETAGVGEYALLKYKAIATQFLAFVDRKMLASHVKPYHLNGWVHTVGKKWSDNTKAAHISIIKGIFTWGRKQGYLTTNPLEDVKGPQRTPRTEIMDRADEDRLIDSATDHEFANLLLVCRASGMRPSEAYRMEADWIDFTRGTVSFPVSKTSRRTGRQRIVFLPEEVIKILRPLCRRYPNGPVLRNTRGKPWTRSSTNARFIRYRKQLGLGKEATLESFRHAFATNALAAGIPIATTAALMGHVDGKMIERVYSKLYKKEDHLRAAVEKLSDVEKKKPAKE